MLNKWHTTFRDLKYGKNIYDFKESSYNQSNGVPLGH
jgi:hypothetical protein